MNPGQKQDNYGSELESRAGAQDLRAGADEWSAGINLIGGPRDSAGCGGRSRHRREAAVLEACRALIQILPLNYSRSTLHQEGKSRALRWLNRPC